MVTKECGEIETDSLGYWSWYNRFVNEFSKSDIFEVVMYYNDEVF